MYAKSKIITNILPLKDKIYQYNDKLICEIIDKEKLNKNIAELFINPDKFIKINLKDIFFFGIQLSLVLSSRFCYEQNTNYIIFISAFMFLHQHGLTFAGTSSDIFNEYAKKKNKIKIRNYLFYISIQSNYIKHGALIQKSKISRTDKYANSRNIYTTSDLEECPGITIEKTQGDYISLQRLISMIEKIENKI